MNKNYVFKHLKNEKAFTPTVGFDEVLIKSKRSKEPSLKFTIGFTLIELLVVVAIIGILSSVVVVSINAAREKSKASFVKSSLKSLYNEAEIFYTQNGTYAGLYNTTTHDCMGDLSDIAESMTLQGVTVKCYSRNDSSNGDIYLRFGATAIIYDLNAFKAWSVDQNGVVTWEQKGVDSSGDPVEVDVSTGMTFSVANTACADSKARLPSLEQLVTISSAYLQASGSGTPVGFGSASYWSSTLSPSNNSLAYIVYVPDTYITAHSIDLEKNTRCVK